jgi:murein L,D-transpeptidase YafK
LGIVHPSGSSELIRAVRVRAALPRALAIAAALTALLMLGGCLGDALYQIPTQASNRLSPQMLALLKKKHMAKDSPILIRIFKEEAELEVWKVDDTGSYALLKVYPICRWSGNVGPKLKDGDRQAPEGFYSIAPGQMNPDSDYYLAINIGFPNAYDRANGRTGAFLMIHGDCSSRGCYAMTDDEMGEIYALARDAFDGGQKAFQIQAYPFRMTAANLAYHRNNPNMPFWRMIKQGNDIFEISHLQPKVGVCARHYVFDAVPPAGIRRPLVFNPTGPCPRYRLDPTIAAALKAKQRHDNRQFARLVKQDAPMAPLDTGTDGGMNRVFLAKLSHEKYWYDAKGHMHVPPWQPGNPPPAISPPPGSESDVTAAIDRPANKPGGGLNNLIGGLFASGRNNAEEPSIAAAAPTTPLK